MSDPNNPLPSFLQSIVNSFARHILTSIGTGLAMSAGLSQAQEQQFVLGGAAVITWLAGIGWSIMEKKAAHTA